MRLDLDPPRLQISVRRLSDFLRCGLVFALLEEVLRDPIMRQRTGWVRCERFSILLQRGAGVALTKSQRRASAERDNSKKRPHRGPVQIQCTGTLVSLDVAIIFLVPSRFVLRLYGCQAF